MTTLKVGKVRRFPSAMVGWVIFSEVVGLEKSSPNAKTGWPLVGNEGMKPYMVMMGIHSFIPY